MGSTCSEELRERAHRPPADMAASTAAVMHALFDSDSDELPQAPPEEAAAVVRLPPAPRARPWEQP